MSTNASEWEDSAARCPIHGGPLYRRRSPQGRAQEAPHERGAGAERHLGEAEARRVGHRMCPMSPKQERSGTARSAAPQGLGAGGAR